MIKLAQSKYFRGIAVFVLFTFLDISLPTHFQIANYPLSANLQASESIVPVTDLNQNNLPSAPVITQTSSESVVGDISGTINGTDVDFLSASVSLGAADATESDEAETLVSVEEGEEADNDVQTDVIETSEEKETENEYVTEVYDTASDGIHELQPGMPVAYFANTVTAADLRALRDREEEV